MCKESCLETPFDRIEKCLIEKSDGAVRFINAAKASLNFSTTADGTLNSNFVNCLNIGLGNIKEKYLDTKKVHIDKKILRCLEALLNSSVLKKELLLKFLNVHWKKFEPIMPTTEEGSGTEIYILLGLLIVHSLDYETVHCTMASHALNIFNNFCLSVLKAEYLYDDDLSISKIEPLRSVLMDKVLRNGNEKETVVLAIGSVDLDYYINAIVKLCDLYLAFNKRIDNLIDPERRTTIDDRMVYASNCRIEYQHSMNTLITEPQNTVGLGDLSGIFPFLFLNILDVTYIDHNFCITEEAIIKLVNAKNTIDKVRYLFNGPSDVMKLLREYNTIYETIHILNLVKFKVDFLLYKILDSEKLNTTRSFYNKRLKSYTIITDGTAFLFENTRKKYADYKNIDFIDKDKILTKYTIKDSVKNDLLGEFTCFSNILTRKTKENLLIDESFVKYEKAILSSIKSINNKKEATAQSDQVEDYFEECNVPFTKHKDITSYNTMISNHTKETFVKCTALIAEINVAKEKSIDQQIDLYKSIETFVSAENTYSCSFIRKSIIFILDLVSELSELQQFKLTTIDVRRTLELLFSLFNGILEDMDNLSYISNFASLYQHSFYRVSWQNNCNKSFTSIERISFQFKNDKEEDIKKFHEEVYKTYDVSETIFFASTWLEPIGKEALKQTYDILDERRDAVIDKYRADLNNFELDQKINSLNVSFQRKLDESKKDMVQTLGILAAFLALASSSIAGFSACQTPHQYCLVILCVTFSVLCFVAALKVDVQNLLLILLLIFVIAAMSYATYLTAF